MDRAKIRELEEKDRAHVWHPFTQMAEYEKEIPLIIERGEGCFLVDVHGNRYLDGVSSLWTNVHGHCQPEIDKAIRDQLDKVAHTTLLGLANVPSIELAAKLAAIAPAGLNRVFYSDSGSTAVEVALKMAFQYWQYTGQKKRTRFVTLKEAYHGDTIGSVSVGGIELFHSLFEPLLFDPLRVPAPYCYRCSLGMGYPDCNLACASKVEELFKFRREEIAAMIVEPIFQGAAGIIVHPPGYLMRIRQLCQEYDVLLILDEVATGFGRTGTMFACENERVYPDFLALAKGLSSGYLPLAATLTTNRVSEAFKGEFADKKTFFHGHTYTGNPLACAAALANLALFETKKVIERLQPKIEFFRDGLARFTGHPNVGDIRQSGLVAGIELVQDRRTGRPFPWEERYGARVCRAARKHQLLLRPLGDVLVLIPPLAISTEEMEILLSGTYAALEEILPAE